MPLTEEERARIEANRRKAIEKRNKAGVAAKAKSGSGSNQPPLQATNNVPQPKVAAPARQSSNSFYGHGGGRKVSGVCSLSSAERFDVKIGYHEAVVAAVKALPSCRYEWGSFGG